MVEHRSPKPGAVGSSPSTPANNETAAVRREVDRVDGSIIASLRKQNLG